MKSNHKMTSLVSMSAILLLGMQSSIAGDIITVNSVSDQPEPGFTTLREAIIVANVLGGSKIQFDTDLFSVPQTIVLENGEMNITESVTIIGPGADFLTIDGDNLSRIFTIADGSTGAFTVEIQGITFTQGNGQSSTNNGSGGCIYSAETLLLSSSVIKNCSASLEGGGVTTQRADNRIENSVFLNNTTAGRGGGLSHQASNQSRVTGSTFSGNRAELSGGGLNVRQTSSFFVINSTFSNNEANNGAGINSADGAININNSTIYNNLGQGVNLSEDNIQNSIIALNTGDDCVFGDTGINNISNFDSDGSCRVTPLRLGIIRDPILSPLSGHGGLTPTHLPLPGSPVIDSGDECFCAQFDQRGLTRPIDGDGDEVVACDIGAVEVTTLEDNDLIFIDGFDEFITPIQDNDNFTLIRGC